MPDSSGPLHSVAVVDALAADLRSAGYTTDGVAGLLGADVGEGPEQTARRGRQWLDWFADEGITGIGMGVIALRAPRPSASASTP
ncbi:hypothetical protein AU193_14140 [Mycobacterium sp. GA-1285]|uniref:hypothetical protein n=1 Tax=Mycobacterium sp. GA-1285 TaxID=1772282 RepID=UPI000749E625|nr:hypothetical protein [Mycobacterium sp. GA-1285]KUI19169.1 hypothetical protein AU193_14140 [Mycobacterium sp. GA-1285]